MDWSALKPIAGKLAQSGLPYLGQILGDAIPFPGGSIAGRFAGEWAGNMIAEALGVPPTPEAITTAVESTSPTELQAKLARAENEAASKWEAAARIAEAEAADRTAQSQAINETQRAEIAAGVSWWHWRHLIGYVYLIWFLIPIPAFVRLTFFYNPEAVTQLTALIGACVPLYGFMSAVLGYVARDTTKLKETAITGEREPGLIESAKAAVKTVVTKVPAAKPATKTVTVIGRD